MRWIGAPDSESPAPIVTVTKAPAAAAAASAPGPTAGAASDTSGDGASKGLAITALIVGALGLVAGAAALATRRRAVRTG